jgi:hypothetical protein
MLMAIIDLYRSWSSRFRVLRQGHLLRVELHCPGVGGLVRLARRRVL